VVGRMNKRFWQIFSLIVLQLVALTIISRMYELEEALNLWILLSVTTVGFIIHAFLSKPYRIWFFASLSLILLALLVGLKEMAFVFVFGTAVIATATKVKDLWLKYILLAVLILGLIVSMAFKPGPIQANIYVISVLGSMFVFRLSLFLYDKKFQKEETEFIKDWSYFFMFPNMSLLLFPVVDYKMFQKRYYDDEEIKIYKKGVQWVTLGVLHLVLYRFVYYYLLLPYVEVNDVYSFWHYAITNYMLIIRLSGIFHISVGVMCLFGFNLPKVFDNYFLASSFSDLWRRINIYFRDYLIRLFYYPLFFKLRKWGDLNAKVVAILIIFVITWFLHSFQWFWLRGSFPLRTVDAIFWGGFGLLVAGNAVLETKRGRKKESERGWKYSGIMTSKIMGMFLTMSILWSIWSAPTLSYWLEIAGFGVSGSLNSYGFLFFMAAGVWGAGTIIYYLFTKNNWGEIVNPEYSSALASVWSAGIVVVLLVLHFQPVQKAASQYASVNLDGLLEPRLNEADEDLLVEGYYEEILIGNELTSPLADLMERDEDRRFRSSDGALIVDDIRNVIKKESQSFLFKGQPFHTNSLGIRDIEYPLVKGENTIRSAILGGSFVVGSGVSDENVFDQLLENRLGKSNDSLNVEFWNYGNSGYHLIQSMYDFEVREAVSHNFDNLIYVSHGLDKSKNIQSLSQYLRRSNKLPYPFLTEIYNRSGISASMSENEMIRALEPFGSEILIQSYKYLYDFCIQNDIRPIWLYWPTTRSRRNNEKQVGELINMVRDIGFTVIDLGNVYDGVEKKDLFVSANKPVDGHPNELGHRLVSDALYNTFMDDPSLLHSETYWE